MDRSRCACRARQKCLAQALGFGLSGLALGLRNAFECALEDFAWSRKPRAKSRSAALALLGTTRHFQPVQLLFNPMKGIVADLITGTHGENGLSRRLEGSTMQLSVRCLGGIA